MDEAGALAAARQGDVEAFNTLVRAHQDGIYSFCLRMLASPGDAEDACQDTFLKAWTRLESLHGDAFRPWLFRIAYRTCLDQLRRHRPQPLYPGADDPLATEPVDPDPTPQTIVENSELAAVLLEALNTLPETQRAAILMYDVQGLAYEEIAMVQDVAVGTIKSRISRGRDALQTWIADHRPELLPSRSRPTKEDAVRS